MFSIAGIPPLIGFLAKMHILLAVIGVSFHFLAFFIIFCSVISTFYYIRIIKISYFENILVGKLYYPIHTIKVLILSVIILLLFYLFINPTLLYLMTYKVNLHVLPKIKIFMSLNS